MTCKRTPSTASRSKEWEQRLIKEAMKRSKFNVNEAAELLGISRATLYRKTRFLQHRSRRLSQPLALVQTLSNHEGG